MRNSVIIPLLLFIACKSPSQDTANMSPLADDNALAEQRQLIAGCEGCEAIFEYTDTNINAVDTLPDFNDNNGPGIKISGTVYKPGGKEPARGVVLYVYHTNQEGIYPTRGGEKGWAKRHGYIRGWVRTDKNGKYTFYTLKPATYPSRSGPAHIHITLLEPNGKYYWIEAYRFKGDPLLKPNTTSQSPRGGHDGIIRLKPVDNLLVGKRDIELGKNVPLYQRD